MLPSLDLSSCRAFRGSGRCAGPVFDSGGSKTPPKCLRPAFRRLAQAALATGARYGEIDCASKAPEAVRPSTSAAPPKADVNSPPWLPPLSVELRCGAVAVGRTYLFPPLSSGGALVVR